MAVDGIWMWNAPSGTFTKDDMSQLLVGFNMDFAPSVPPEWVAQHSVSDSWKEQGSPSDSWKGQGSPSDSWVKQV